MKTLLILLTLVGFGMPVGAAEVPVVFIAGQSNASGRAPLVDLPADPQADAKVDFTYRTDADGGGLIFTNDGELGPFAPPGPVFGPEFGIARQLVNGHAFPALAIVKNSKGATSLHVDWAAGSTLYADFLNDADRAIQALGARGDTPVPLAFYWNQGERDAATGGTRVQYAADLLLLVQRLRSDLEALHPGIGFENLRVIVSETSSKPLIAAAQADIAALDSNTFLIPTGDLTYLPDNLHFDGMSLMTMGERAAEAMVATGHNESSFVESAELQDFEAASSADGWFIGAAHHAPLAEVTQENGELLAKNSNKGLLWNFFRNHSDAAVLAEAGESIELKFKICFANTSDGGGDFALRFGIFDSGGQRRTSDLPANTNSDASFNNWTGVLAVWGSGASSSSQGYFRTGPNGNPCSITDGVQAMGASFSGIKFTDGNWHKAALRVERVAEDSVQTKFSLGNSASHVRSFNWPKDTPLRFDSFAILNTPQTGSDQFAIDNFSITMRLRDASLPPVPALRISEVQPDGANPFVEIENIGATAIDLEGLRFTEGLVMTIDSGSLAPGGKIIATTNPQHFPTLIAYRSFGDITPGETLTLEDRYGRVIERLEIAPENDPNWPQSKPTDRTYTRIAGTDHWRISAAVDGSPGSSDSTTLRDWQTRFELTGDASSKDSDNDGFTDLIEYGLGTDPTDFLSKPDLKYDCASNQIRYSHAIAADDVTVEIETSSDLKLWSVGETREISAVPDGDRLRITCEDLAPDEKRFARLRVSLRGAVTPPNVLFISIDDLRPQIGAYGRSQMVTPNLDRFASTGRLFRNHYAQVASCGPSRYSMLSGRRAKTIDNHAVANLIPNSKIPGSPSSMVQAFHQSGFKTIAIGKISHQPSGFSGGKEELPFSWDESNALDWSPWPGADQAFHGYAGGVTRNAGVSPPTEVGDYGELYQDELIADHALRTLDNLASTGERFFLGVGFFKPHLPFTAPKEYWDLYDPAEIILPPQTVPSPLANSAQTVYSRGELMINYGQHDNPNFITEAEGRRLTHGYYAAVSYVDAQVGRVLDKLDELGLADNTIVVVWGDHGWHLGEHTVWGKHTNLEEGVHSALIVRTPRLPFRGKATSSLVEAIDIYPTLASLCGVVPATDVAGVSFGPILDNPQATTKKGAFSYWNRLNRDGFTVRTDRFRYVRWGPANSPAQRELYDYQTDPLGKSNIAADHPELINELELQIQNAYN